MHFLMSNLCSPSEVVNETEIKTGSSHGLQQKQVQSEIADPHQYLVCVVFVQFSGVFCVVFV